MSPLDFTGHGVKRGFSRFRGGLGEWDEWDDELPGWGSLGMGFDEGD